MKPLRCLLVLLLPIAAGLCPSAKAQESPAALPPRQVIRLGGPGQAPPALVQRHAAQTFVEQKSAAGQPASAQSATALSASQVLSALPKGIGGPPREFRPVPAYPEKIVRPTLAQPLTDDLAEVFVTTYERPTQPQAERLATLLLGRPATAGELTLCAPAEGFILTLPPALAGDGPAREKAKARLLAEPDVVTVTPAVLEGPERYHLPGHVLAYCRPEMTLAAVEKMVRPLGAQVLEEHDQRANLVYLIQVPKGADPRRFAETLEKAGLAEEVVPDIQATMQHCGVIPNDPLYGSQWHLEQGSDKDIDAERAYQIFSTYGNLATWVTVALVDGEGIEMTHPDRGTMYFPYDAVNGDDSPAVESTFELRGTPAFGAAAAATDNGVGVAGPLRGYTFVTPVKIGYNWDGAGNFLTSLGIVSRMATHCINTPRMTATSHSYANTGTFWSGSASTSYLNLHNQPREGKGAVLVASAGNGNAADPEVYPSSYSWAVSVGGTDRNDVRSFFSNYGWNLEMAAPATGVYTFDRLGSVGYNINGDYASVNGTSYEAPIVAAACGAIARQQSSMSRDSITWCLLSTCDKAGLGYSLPTSYGYKSFQLGHGRLNLANAIGLANGYINAYASVAANLVCGSTYSGTTVGASSTCTDYFWTSKWVLGAPDVSFTLNVTERAVYNIKFTAKGETNLRLVLMENQWSSSIISTSLDEITVLLEPGLYYLVVDGSVYTTVGTFSLAVHCNCLPTYSNAACASGDFLKSVRLNLPSFDSSGCTSNRFYTNYKIGAYGESNVLRIEDHAQNRLELHSGPQPQCFLAFLDMNNDGTFSASERVYANNTPSTKAVGYFNAASLSFPYGSYRKLRIITSREPFADLNNPCPSLAYGETEEKWVSCWRSFPLTFGVSKDEIIKGMAYDTGRHFQPPMHYVSMSFYDTLLLDNYAFKSTGYPKRMMALIKVGPYGFRELMTIAGNTQFDMDPQGVGVDEQGYVYWAGSYAGSISFLGLNGLPVVLHSTGSYDAFIAKFEPAAGRCMWARSIGSTGSDFLYGCFVSNSGNVYAGGSYGASFNFPSPNGLISMPNAGGLDGFIVKLDKNGNNLWATRMGSTGNDEVKSIEYNGGDLVACGYMNNGCQFPGVSSTITMPTIAGSKDGWAARINSTGKFVWVKNFGSAAGDEAMSICMDPSTGNVFAAAQVGGAMTFKGVTHAHRGHNDIAVAGWNFYTQAQVWGSQVGSGSSDVPYQMRWDGKNLVVAGQTSGTVNYGTGTAAGFGGSDIAVLRYNKTTGAVAAAQLFGGPGTDRAHTMWCNTATQEAVVGGGFSATAGLPPGAIRAAKGGMDAFLIKVQPPGSLAREEVEEETIAASANGLKAWPVPVRAGGSLTLQAEAGAWAEIWDVQGRRVSAFALQPGRSQVKAPAVPGLYVVRTAGGALRLVVE